MKLQEIETMEISNSICTNELGCVLLEPQQYPPLSQEDFEKRYSNLEEMPEFLKLVE